MEKTLSRKLTRWAKGFLIADGFFAIATVFGVSSVGIFALVVVGLTAIGVVLMLIANRCPHCGEAFRGGEWSKPHAGYCNKCGKLMEYDDTVAEREYKRKLKQE